MWNMIPFVLHWAGGVGSSAWCWKLVFNQVSTLTFPCWAPSCPTEVSCTGRDTACGWAARSLGMTDLGVDQGWAGHCFSGLCFCLQALEMSEECGVGSSDWRSSTAAFCFSCLQLHVVWSGWTLISLPRKHISYSLVTCPWLELPCCYPLHFLQMLSAIFQHITENPWTWAESCHDPSPGLCIFLVSCLF